MWRPGWLLAAALALAMVGWWSLSRTPPAPGAPSTAAPMRAVTTGNCAGPSRFQPAAHANAATLSTLAWAPFGPAEIGWETYAPLIAREIGTTCGPADPGFADALARWQATETLSADGMLKPADFDVLRVRWLRRRPFVVAMGSRLCPPSPDEASLAATTTAETFGQPRLVRPKALDAYRRMVEAARREQPQIAADPGLLSIFSAFRGPEEEAARCAERACDGRVRARCSAHRTGLALDLSLGAAPGSRRDSTDDANRLFQTRGQAYRWMVANADRFGFVPYPYEPWHWEWTGEPIGQP